MGVFKKCLGLICIYGAASFLGLWVLFGIILTIFKKGPRWFFGKKTRNSRPECMQDSSLGTHGFVRVQDVRLHYVASGSTSKPLMLLVHGFPENWYSWRYQIKEFKNDYRVVALDMRGYCESEVLPGTQNYAMSKLTGDIKEVITALGYSSCVLVAHDWGGAVAWTFATEYPNLVDKLICMNMPNPYRFQQHLESSLKQMMKSWYMLFFMLPALPELMVSSGDYKMIESSFRGRKMGLKIGRENITEEDIDAFKFGISQPGTLTAAINYYRAAFQYPHKPPRNSLGKRNTIVKSPCLLIWGDGDGAFDNGVLDGHDEFASDFTLMKVPGASHWVQQDAPEECNRFMKEFLGRK